MARTSAAKTTKTKKIIEIDEYLSYFKEKKEETVLLLKSLNDSINNIKGQIKDNENTLKNKVNDIAKRKKTINSKLHDVNGDYTTTHLLQAAEQLKILNDEQTSVEEELNSQKKELKVILSEEESKKADAEKKDASLTKITAKAKSELEEVSSEYTVVVNKINAAIEVCENSNLKMALEEEKSNMRARLGEITDKYIEEVNEILEIRKPGTFNEVDDLFKNEKIINIEPEVEKHEVSHVTEIEIPEISFNLPKEEEPRKIEIEVEEESTPVEEKESYDEDRKVVDIKNISTEQKEAIENSSVVEKGLTNFFKRTLK